MGVCGFPFQIEVGHKSWEIQNRYQPLTPTSLGVIMWKCSLLTSGRDLQLCKGISGQTQLEMKASCGAGVLGSMSGLPLRDTLCQTDDMVSVYLHICTEHSPICAVFWGWRKRRYEWRLAGMAARATCAPGSWTSHIRPNVVIVRNTSAAHCAVALRKEFVYWPLQSHPLGGAVNYCSSCSASDTVTSADVRTFKSFCFLIQKKGFC